jgi:poly(A) polymerase
MLRDLHAADWTRRAGLVRLREALGADNIRWVGGAVRDGLLGIAAHDVDCATLLVPDEVVAACKAAGLRTVPTGIAHGTVTAILEDGPVEITTVRRDVATDGRRATIAFASDWREDAARRDFTINALYADPVSFAVSDYFDGLADLRSRRVRFIGRPEDRIAEDHLRILRYYRFQARFGAELDDAAEAACAALANMLKGLSRERIGAELFSLLALPDPYATLERMYAKGVLGVILPETGAQELAVLEALISRELAGGFAAAPPRRLAALLPPSPELAEEVAARLRLSKEQRHRLAVAAARTAGDSEHPRALAYRVGTECAIDRLLLIGAETVLLTDWQPPVFPLKGGAIVKKGITAGPQVARILRCVEARWVIENFPSDERLGAILSEELTRIAHSG